MAGASLRQASGAGPSSRTCPSGRTRPSGRMRYVAGRSPGRPLPGAGTGLPSPRGSCPDAAWGRDGQCMCLRSPARLDAAGPRNKPGPVMQRRRTSALRRSTLSGSGRGWRRAPRPAGHSSQRRGRLPPTPPPSAAAGGTGCGPRRWRHPRRPAPAWAAPPTAAAPAVRGGGRRVSGRYPQEGAPPPAGGPQHRWRTWSQCLPRADSRIASGVLQRPRTACVAPTATPVAGSSTAPASPAAAPLTNPLKPAWCAPMAGAAMSPTVPAITPLATLFSPLDSPAAGCVAACVGPMLACQRPMLLMCPAGLPALTSLGVRRLNIDDRSSCWSSSPLLLLS